MALISRRQIFHLWPLRYLKLIHWIEEKNSLLHDFRQYGNGPTANYKPQDIALRGFVKTDATGAYKFTTIYPGEYTGRTRHIHIKVTPEGKSTLTTQLILAKSGDSISFDDDTISRGLPMCHLLKFDETTKPKSANFEFRL